MTSLPPDPFQLPVAGGGELEGLLSDPTRPVLLDFFAAWCGPCAWIVPTLRTLAEEYGDRLAVVKVDVDADPQAAERFRIGSVPTVILWADGEEVGRSVGVEPPRVRKMVEELLGPGSKPD
ncbi:MAG: thiol reductase thioredoxin [Gemmatimonadales bacterium]|nr:MAG: thiol reductase thioredoxin [Gemmatimonadales bacterium]